MMLVLCALAAMQSGPDADFFEKKIRPVLVDRCFSCHSVAANKRKGGLLLDSREAILKGGDSGPAAIAGAPEKSLMVRVIRYEDDLKMPPKGKLPASTLDDLVSWIQRGLPWPGSEKTTGAVAEGPKALPWSFRPIRKSALSDIDQFLEPRGAVLDRAALLRRVTFDIVGLPPTVEELAAFLAEGNLEKVVDRLLASPRFGERWARHWMDVVRYADSNGCGADYTLDDAWRYRDYIIAAFNDDKPYDVFVREQIAGDLMTPPVPVATGFLLVGPKELAEYDKEKLRMDVVDEQLNTIGQAFLGLTFGCARCHDHKFDPIPTADYYALAGILRSTRSIPPGNISGPISGWNRRLMEPGQEKALADWKKEVEKARSKLVHVRERKGAAAEARALERTLAKTATDDPERPRLEAEIQKKKSIVPVPPAEVARLEAEMVQALMRPKPDEALAVQDESAPRDLQIHIRGDARNLGAPAARGFLSAIPLGIKIDPKSSGRLQLAEWITHPDHPLTARVWVNRVYQHLMGEGLVRTPDNFGARGEAPTNPELLDFLAVRLREERGSLKSLVRRIVLSRAYSLRRPFRRLDAEALRDAMLSISGELDPTAGGSTMTYTGRLFIPLESSPLPVDPWRRRAVYLPVYRGTTPPDLLEAFDVANSALVTGRRASTTVPTQALFLMNSPFVLDRARATARSTPDVDLLYRKILGRAPTDHQRQRALDFVRGAGEDGWTDLVQALFSSNEFLFLE